MRKILLIFLSLILFIFHLAFFGYADQEDKREDAKNQTKEEQLLKTKAETRKWEVSISAYLDIERYRYYDQPYRLTTISIPLRIGYFLTKTLEIESEINSIFTSSEFYHESRTFFLANLAMNFNASSRVVPFILGGAGVKYFRWSYNIEWQPGHYSETKLAFNAGAGLKWFAAKRFAFRIEYRFFYYNEYDVNVTRHKAFVGISIFF